MEAVVIGLVVLGAAFIAYKKFFSKDNASLTLSVADIQSVQTQDVIENVDGVFVNFKGLEIQPKEGDRLSFEFDAKIINLMDNTGNELLDGQDVPVGEYSWIRLNAVTADSYVIFEGVKGSLEIPSGDQSGLKLNRGFRIGEEGADFTIDFNLEKSLINPGGKGWKLKPVLSLIDNLGPIAPIGGSPEPTA